MRKATAVGLYKEKIISYGKNDAYQIQVSSNQIIQQNNKNLARLQKLDHEIGKSNSHNKHLE